MFELEPVITASEAVYGFAAWLTTRDQIISVGSSEDAAGIADLVNEWVTTNGLPGPRQNIYPNNILQP